MKINADRNRVLAVSFDGEVTRIEVEKIVLPSEDDTSTSYSRTVRFSTHTGEVLEVFCDAETQKKLELVEVDQLGPVGRVRTKTSWLKPRMSTGTRSSDEPEEG